jgi:hypothetical protein
MPHEIWPPCSFVEDMYGWIYYRSPHGTERAMTREFVGLHAAGVTSDAAAGSGCLWLLRTGARNGLPGLLVAASNSDARWAP